ncbi:MAG: class I SAM-dependent methyltransferase [Candidatus Kapabacteria bacterium]|nr:class I SAM-dependent methyltransferase [Candidatus Kapabacteria bacterium]
MKDFFSSISHDYLKFRPDYPSELFDYINLNVKDRSNALDCGTGNGQLAFEISNYFTNVYAIDISQNQITEAIKRDNIFYSLCNSESTQFQDNFFDLIAVAQAIHWFDFDRFYSEVYRIIKPDGIFVATGYGLFRTDTEIDRLLRYFNDEIIGNYWDKVRHYIDESYKTIPFPFNEIHVPEFESKFYWTFDQVIGYLNTWSCVKTYFEIHDRNPLDIIYNQLKNLWGKEQARKVIFPIFTRLGRANRL